MTRLFKAAVLALTLAFAVPVTAAPAFAAGKTQMGKHKASQHKSKAHGPCDKHECMKAVPGR